MMALSRNLSYNRPEQARLGSFMFLKRSLEPAKKKKIEAAMAVYLEEGLNLDFEHKKILNRSKRGKLKQFESLILKQFFAVRFTRSCSHKNKTIQKRLFRAGISQHLSIDLDSYTASISILFPEIEFFLCPVHGQRLLYSFCTTCFFTASNQSPQSCRFLINGQ